MNHQNNKAPALTRHIDIRVDQQSYDHILDEAYQAKLNLSDYVRQCMPSFRSSIIWLNSGVPS